MLPTVSFLAGRPMLALTGNAAFKIFVNCSCQLGLLGSFQITVWFTKFKLFESLTLSVVLTDSIFSKPLAA